MCCSLFIFLPCPGRPGLLVTASGHLALRQCFPQAAENLRGELVPAEIQFSHLAATASVFKLALGRCQDDSKIVMICDRSF